MHKQIGSAVLTIVLFGPLTVVSAQTGSESESTAINCLSLAIYHEARGEPILGQLAVAWVVMNRVASKRWPDTVCEVVWQRRQFSWTHDGRSDTPRERKAWRHVQRLAKRVYHSETENVIGGATHYHATYIKEPGWARHFTRVASIGQHIFYQ